MESAGPRGHWETVYDAAEIEHLGWHEENPGHSMEMIRRSAALPEDLLLDVGSGASTLIPTLLRSGYRNIAAADISSKALQKARGRLPAEEECRVKWIVDDVLEPRELNDLEDRVRVWHDRALFHFLVDDEDRLRYVDTLRRLVSTGGHVIIATFSLHGVDRCSGLPVRRYDAQTISDFLGKEFRPVHSFECLYLTPGGDPRPYVYTLSRRLQRGES